nr:MAG TPA: hypothetical protein [Caudoviricetes sp.]
MSSIVSSPLLRVILRYSAIAPNMFAERTLEMTGEITSSERPLNSIIFHLLLLSEYFPIRLFFGNLLDINDLEIRVDVDVAVPCEKVKPIRIAVLVLQVIGFYDVHDILKHFIAFFGSDIQRVHNHELRIKNSVFQNLSGFKRRVIHQKADNSIVGNDEAGQHLVVVDDKTAGILFQGTDSLFRPLFNRTGSILLFCHSLLRLSVDDSQGFDLPDIEVDVIDILDSGGLIFITEHELEHHIASRTVGSDELTAARQSCQFFTAHFRAVAVIRVFDFGMTNLNRIVQSFTVLAAISLNVSIELFIPAGDEQNVIQFLTVQGYHVPTFVIVHTAEHNRTFPDNLLDVLLAEIFRNRGDTQIREFLAVDFRLNIRLVSPDTGMGELLPIDVLLFVLVTINDDDFKILIHIRTGIEIPEQDGEQERPRSSHSDNDNAGRFFK